MLASVLTPLTGAGGSRDSWHGESHLSALSVAYIGNYNGDYNLPSGVKHDCVAGLRFLAVFRACAGIWESFDHHGPRCF